MSETNEKIILQQKIEMLQKRCTALEQRLSCREERVKTQERIIQDQYRDGQKKCTEELLRNSNDLLRAVIEAAPVAIFDLDLDGNVRSVWNPASERMLGWRAEEVLGKPLPILPVEPEDEYMSYRKQLSRGIVLNGVEVSRRRRNGSLINYSIYSSHIHDAEGRIVGNIAVLADISERKKSERRLFESERKYRTLTESLPDNIIRFDTACRAIYVNPAMKYSTGFDIVDHLGKTPLKIPGFPSPKIFQEKLEQVLQTGRQDEMELHVKLTNGSSRQHLVRFVAERDDRNSIIGALSIGHDVTENKQLEEQLRQAQKMEAIGQLAGGVAHDFNNMLGVIIGHSEMAMYGVDPDLPVFSHLREIHKAAELSADLTRQLLAFARKQTVASKVLDINKTVEGTLKMLRRLIGEDIDLAWLPGNNVAPVKMDPSQFDQILANLCVNARDAIAGNGKVTIETTNVVIDDSYCRKNLEALPGDFVSLTVSDNGCGMNKETLRKVFEPFFTTKRREKGTGLGLATVYGIVKQNNGFINVYSESNLGTSFKLYFPVHKTANEEMSDEERNIPPMVAKGNETILIVEDELPMLEMVTMMLEQIGYDVLTASTPVEALQLVKESTREIHLVLTDVVMPELSGKELVEKIAAIHPKIRCLYMSGYTDNAIAHRGVLDEGVHFIEKPFSIQDIAAKVREVMGKKPVLPAS